MLEKVHHWEWILRFQKTPVIPSAQSLTHGCGSTCELSDVPSLYHHGR